MTNRPRRRISLLLLGIALIAALGLLVYELNFGREPWRPLQGASASESASPSASKGAAAPAAQATQEAREKPREASTAAADPLATSVAWPLEIELDLLVPAEVPVVSGVPPLGSGKRARLRGQIFGRSAAGVRATITFRSGLNLGTRIETAADGTFGPVDLYPGLAEVEVSAPGVPGSVRELRLASDQSNELNISYGLPGVVLGKVSDTSYQPLEGVDVELDGQHTFSDANGRFRFDGMTGGDNLLIVLSKRGFATRMRRVGVAAGRTTESETMQFLLEPGASLEISVLDKAGVGDKAQAVILPANADLERTYPWHRLVPLDIVAGSSLLVEDLPATRVAVRVYHHGAVAEPEVDMVALRPGVSTLHQVHMRPVSSSASGKAPAAAAGPSGRAQVRRVFGRVVDRAGTGVSNARVTLEVPDRVGAANTLLGDPSGIGAVQREMIPPMAQFAQETRSDAAGRFDFTVWPFYAPGAHYLSAQSPDGKLRGIRVVQAGEEQADVVVQPIDQGTATLRIEFPRRTQALPVVTSVDGVSLGQRVIARDDVLELPGLAKGNWKLSARWHAEGVGGGGEFTLSADRSIELTLPPGAIEGQDPDTLLRARGR